MTAIQPVAPQPYALPVFDPAGRAVTETIVSVKVMQTESMHDTAIITLRGADTTAPYLQPGTPVQMQYGWQSVDLDWFYGYVDHIENHYDRAVGELSTLEDVVCLGASYSLKQPFVGAWMNAEASSLVQQIANQYYLSSVIETDDTVWPQLSSPGESAWCFLTQLGTKTGYTLACNKTMLRFMSVDLSMQNYWQTMPVFQSKKVAPSPANQTLTFFQSLTSESLTASGVTKAVRHISGMDLSTGQIVGAVNSGAGTTPLGKNQNYPFFSQQVSTQVVNSQGHAQDTLSGMYEDNRFAYQATAIISGLTAVRQGVPIVLYGIDSTSDGTWWVQEAVHTIKTPSYSIHVSLGRDATGNTGLLPTLGSSVTYSPSNPFSYTLANAPPTVLVNNRWRAAYASNVSVT
jgi:phage protein D